MVKSTFDIAFEKTMRFEGGFQDDPSDPGNFVQGKNKGTKYGISARQYPELDIQSLTEEEARKIYHRDYWKAPKIDLIPSEMLAIKVFDMAVNMGPGQAIKLLQRSIQACGSMVDVDGIIGGQTTGEIAKIPEQRLMAAYRATCRMYYECIADKNDRNKFLRGWVIRALS